MYVIIMRGIPGSGKSTWARNHAGYCSLIYSADDYFIAPDGTYRFKPEDIGKAHNECLNNYMVAIQNLSDGVQPSVLPTAGVDSIIVDNTNLSAWEIAPYYRIAECYNIPVKIVQMSCPYEVAVSRQTHDVPHEKLWSMWQKLHHEILPPQWKVKIELSE